MSVVALRRRTGVQIARTALVDFDERATLDFGAGCSVAWGAVIIARSLDDGLPSVLNVGDRVGIGEYANIRASQSEITLGDGVLFGQFVSLIGANHLLTPDGPHPTRTDQAKSGIVIGDRCWLGTHATVLPGVELGAQCIVAAGAVVTKSYPSGTRVAGVPARRVG